MGDLLRRYWTPALLIDEIPEPDSPPVRVRLLGEDLVAFRDSSGKVGLIGEHCPHRGASLYFGRNEECGLRCVYHGWKFDADGHCVDMPNEPAARNFKDRITATAYPTHESGGMVWAYLGPAETMTPFRDFGTEDLQADEVAVTKYYTECNWVQSLEGSIDTAHVSFLHQWNAIDDIPDDGTDQPGYPSNAMAWKFLRHDRNAKLDFEYTWYGFRYAGIRTTPNGFPHARIGVYIVPWGVAIPVVPFSSRQSILVPIDDEHSWRYMFFRKSPGNPRRLGGAGAFEGTPYRVTSYARGRGLVASRDYSAENDYQIDRDVQRKVSFTGVGDFMAQDLLVTESMGAIVDHSQEHLGSTDLAITRMRSILLNAAKGLTEGKEPPGLPGPGRNFMEIRAAEKILDQGEDWRILGTDEDPVVKEGLAAG
jgi:phthalate 4,5-dioxygenase